MTIGDLAGRSGLPASTIRYYESAGLLPKPPRAGGRRVYDEDCLNQIAFVQFARESGFTIAEIRTLTARPVKSPLSPRMQKLAAAKMVEIDQSIERAQTMRKLLAEALTCRCLNPMECGRRIRQRMTE